MTTSPALNLVTEFQEVRDRILGGLERLRFYAERVRLNAEELLEIDRVIERARKGTFSIAVVGEFKRGKSTFINAMLGQEILPADALPCSATLNRVRYGARPAAQLVYKATADAAERIDMIAVETLKEHVTQLTEESAERAADIEQATVFFPLPFLEQNDIIDTPGLNDSADMTAVTLGVLPEVDAAIMVVIPQAPFGKTEEQFLNHLLAHDIGRVMFVVNRIDQVRRPADRERIIESITERIRESTRRKAEELFQAESEEFQRYLQRMGAIKIFGLSARQALDARVANDPELLARSGFPEFEQALQSFLTQQRGAIRLKIIAGRVLRSGAKIIQTIDLRLGALAMSQEQFDTAYRQSAEQLHVLDGQLHERLGRIDSAAARTRNRAYNLLAQLGDELLKSAEETIDAIEIGADELDPKQLRALSRDLRQKVSDAIAQASQTMSDRIQLTIAQELEQELLHLEDLALDVDRNLHTIAQLFAPDTDARSPSFAGAAFGNLANRGAVTMGGALTALVLGLGAMWPVVLALGVASVFGSAWISKNLLVEKRARLLKQQYKQDVRAAIEEKLRGHSDELRENIERHVHATFDALKRKAQLEIGGSVEQMRHTVDELQSERALGQARAEHEHAELSGIRDTVAQMCDDARIVDAEVVQVLSAL